MGHGQHGHDQPRRIVPPAMPIPAAIAPGAIASGGAGAYTPSSYRRKKSSGRGKIIAICVVSGLVVLAGTGIAMKMAMDMHRAPESALISPANGGSNSGTGAGDPGGAEP